MAPRRQRLPVRAGLAAVVIVLAALAPAIVFGESITPFGLIGVSVLLLAAGLVMRLRGRGEARALGTILVVIGAVCLAAGIGLTILAVGGLGRPY